MNIQTEHRIVAQGDASISVRSATGEDLEPVVELARMVYTATYVPLVGPEYVEMGLAKWWSETAVADAIAAGRLSVAELEGQLVGIGVWGRQATRGPERRRAVIWGVYVLPDVQRSGVGTRLIAELCADVAETGREDVYMSYVQGNERTRRWLEGLGFVEQWRDEGHDLVPTQVWTRKILCPSARAAASVHDS